MEGPSKSLRVIIKCDHESGPPRAAFLYAEHFESPVVELIAATSRAAYQLVPGAKYLKISEGHRNPRVPGKRDLHHELKALDFTIVKEDGSRATEAEYKLVAEAVRAKLGDKTYDFKVHGEGLGVHIHAEVDPK